MNKLRSARYFAVAAAFTTLSLVAVGCTAPQEREEETAQSTSKYTGTATGNAIVATAYTYLGIPYDHSWQNCNPPYAMNCSCLVAKVLGWYGWDLPAHDDFQSTQGRYMSWGNVLPGDLVYFTENGASEVTHIGIYSGRWDGIDHIVHASGYFNAVVESDMSFIDGYAGARRMY